MKNKNEKKDLSEKVYILLDKYRKHTKGFLYDEKIKGAYELLYPGINGSKNQKEFVLSKIKLALLVLIVGGLLTGTLWIKEVQNQNLGDNHVIREDFGEGSKQIKLKAKQDKESVDVNFVLEEKEYSSVEIKELYDSFLEELKLKILGQNVSFDMVSYDLMLCEKLEGYPYEIQWYTDDKYVTKDGYLLQEDVATPMDVLITAKISYKDFYKEECFPLKIYSKSIKKTLQEKIILEMETLEENTRQEKVLNLPTEYEGKAITWKKEVKHQAFLGIILVPLVIVLLMLCKDNDLLKLLELRQIQMTYDYPEIVSKLSLYIAAGMTTQRAFIKIAQEYEKKNQKKHYAYEEMLICVREMENGTPVGYAFENFGRRCQNAKYMKMATLLSQHIKKGTSNIGQELMAEASWAFEERKQQVRQQGEKAGTKLLVPMMILLFMIMTMILVPAFLNQI